MIVGTPSWRSRAPSPIAPCPPPTITTSGCSAYPSVSASCMRASSHVTRSRSAPCSTPLGRCVPFGSSWPLSSYSAVSNVHALPSRRRSSPLPRPAAVSNAIHAVVIPSAVSGGSVVCHPLGCTCSSCASSIASISLGPSTVLRFQVNATRSRQKLSSWNNAAAPALSLERSAVSKSDSHWSTSLTGLSSRRLLTSVGYHFARENDSDAAPEQ